MNLTTPRQPRYPARLLKITSGLTAPVSLGGFFMPVCRCARVCVQAWRHEKPIFEHLGVRMAARNNGLFAKIRFGISAVATSYANRESTVPMLPPNSGFKIFWSLAMLNLSNQNTRLPNLAKPLFALGAVMTCLSLIVQARVYASFGTSFEAVLYVFFGLTLAICTITLPSLSVIFWYSNKVLIALLFAFLAMACLGLSFVSHVGFSAIANANAETTRGAVFSADLADQITATRQQIATVDQRLAACPAGYRANCIEPAQTEKAPLIAKLNALETQKLDHAPSAEHPLFLALDKLRAGNSSSKELFMAGSSLIFEVLAGLILMVAGFFKSQEATDAPVLIAQTPIQNTPMPTPQTPPRTALGTDGQAVNVGGNYSFSYGAANQERPRFTENMMPNTTHTKTAESLDNADNGRVRYVENQDQKAVKNGMCNECGTDFDMTRYERRFCSKACSNKHHNAKKVGVRTDSKSMN